MTAQATFTITINVGADGAVSDQSVLSTFRSNNLNYAQSDFTFSQNSVVDSVAITDTHTTFTYQDGYYQATSFDPYTGAPVGYTAVPTNHTANQISDIRIAGTSAQLRALGAGQSLDVVVHYTDTGYNSYSNYPAGFGETIIPTAEQMTFHFVGVNDAPVLTGTTLSLAAELEDAAAPVGAVGTTVTALLSDFTDYDSSSPAGIAVSGADGTHGTWWYSIDHGTTWSQLGTVSETGALLLAASGGRLYFQPGANFNGTVDPAITFHGWDQTQGTNGSTADVTSNGGETAFSAVTDTASLTITAVNDPPVIAAIGALSYTENQAATLLAPAASVTDIDSANFNGGFLKVSFTANASSDDQLTIVTGGLVKLAGTTVSINGTAIGTVVSSGANGSALEVDLNSAATPAAVQTLMQHIAYANTSDNPSTALRTVTFAVSDGSDTGTTTSTISVTAVNDAPIVNGVTFALSEGGTSVLTAANFNIADPDSASFTYTVSNVTHGVFQTTTDGITWTNATTFTTADIAAGHVHFVHDGGEIAPGFSIQANDGATANNLSGVVAGSVTFTNVNDAPVLLTPQTIDFQDIPHPLDGGFTPLASYSAGGFVFSSSHVGADAFESFHLGHPFYAGSAALANSYDGATTTLQRADGAAFDLAQIDLDSLLTGAPSQVTFVGTLAGGGTVQQTFTLDALRGFQTFAFSADFNHVTSVSWAQTSPYLMIDNVLLDPVPALTSITEDDVSNGGQTVASFLANIADPDAGALQGIAITATANGNGHWEYSTGVGWLTIGAVNDAHALLLRASDLVRFVPNAARGTSASLTYHAWDQSGASAGHQGGHFDLTGGTGGSTPFSSATETATISVTDVNDAPVAAAAAESNAGNEDTAISGTLLAGTDVDGDTLHFALVNGSAQHGAVVIDPGTGAYTFTPDHDYNGAASFQYVLNDGTVNSAPKTVTIAIAPVNDPPVVANAIANLSLAEDTAWSYQVPANTFFDVDGDTLSYAATLGDGSALPGWLGFNAATRTFSGTPPKDFNGSFDFKVTASDAVSSFSDTFTLTVTPVNDAPAFVLSNLALVSASATGATGNSFDESPSFSPDGTKVLFMTGATNLLGSTNWTNAVIKDLTTGALTRVSQTATGTVANGFTDYASFSADGTRVVFESRASNLVSGDTNGLSDVFVKDLASGAVVRVSTTATGGQASGNTTSDVESTPHFSPDGKYVVFGSLKTNLVSGDTNGDRDIFVKAVTDANGNLISNGAIVRVSTAAGGAQGVDQTGSGNGDSDDASFSADGTKVLFVSGATNLVAGDTNNQQDVFLKSIFDQNGNLSSNGAIVLVSQTQGGVLANSYSEDASMSADGSRVAFDTPATNLAPGVDTNAFSDIYVKDLHTGALILASVSKDGVVGNGDSMSPTLSADGTKVLFYSKASNLVAGDTPDGTWDLFVKNLVTGDVTRIALGNNSFDIPQSNAYFSPDGSKVLFYANQDLLAADTNLSDDIYIAGPVAVANVTSIENVAALLDASATVSDAELDLLNGGAGNYAGATLTLVRHGGASAQDAFGFAAGGLFTVNGNALQAGGQTFATVTNTGGTLQISFTSAPTVATKALVNDVLQHVTYANTSDAPPASVQIDYALNDGNAGAQGAGGALIGTGYVDVVITAVNDAPVVTAGNTLNYTENGAATAISPAATVTDPDGATDFNGGSLKISFGATGTSADQLTVGGGTLVISGTTTKTIKIGGNTVGTYSSTTNNGVGGNDLVITFASSGSGVTPANVQTLLEHILYSNTSDAPSTTDRTITYTINDNDGTANNGAQVGSGTATIHVIAVNDAPVAAAAAESKSGNEDTPISGTLLPGTDADGDALSFVLVAGSAQHGTVVINPASGAYSFTPDHDYNGAASFQYVLNDGTVNSAAKTVSLTIAPVNDAPVAAAAAESNAGNEDTPITGTLLAGSDVDGDALHFALVAGSAQHGTVVINPASGAYTFTPDHDYNGAASFQYVVNDGQLNSAPKSVSIAIAPVNDAPVASAAAESNAGNEDTPIAGTLLAGSDVDGDALSFILVNGSSQHGSVVIDAATGAYTFTPDHDYNGAASFQYVVNDGFLNSAPKTVTIAIAPVNDAPVAAPVAESNAGNEDTPISGTLLAGSDVDGDALSFILVNGSSQHGSVVIDAATGAYTFTPDHDYNGAASFQYVVNDGFLNSAPKTVTIAIAPVNDAPVAAPAAESNAGNEDTPIAGTLLAGSDVDGDALSFILVNGSSQHGSVVIDAATGAYTFTPDHDYNGAASFQYVVNDGVLNTAPKTVSIAIAPVNDAPVAAPAAESNAGNEDTPIAGTLLAGSDVDGDALSFILVNGSSQHGAVVIDAATGAYTFTPDQDYNGAASFQYVVNDGILNSAPKTVSIAIAPVNDAPVAQDGSAGGNENATITGSLAASDVDGDPLSYGVVTQAAHGTVTVNSDGTFSYAPNANYHGADSFTFKANDGALDSNVATESLAIAFVNQAPVAQTGTASGNENATIAGSLAASDVEGDALTYGLVTQAAHGTVTINPNGTFSYAPDANYHGADSFTFKANDGARDSNVATESLAIAFVNQPPALHGVAATAAVSGAAAVDLAPSLTVTDVDSTTLAAATVHVGAGAFTAHGDVLSVSAGDLAGTTISAHYDAASETLTLSGTDTLAHYSQALDHVTFQTANFASDRAQTITWQVDDGSAANNLSDIATTAISMPRSQVNDFNASGHSGLLWQNSDGTAAVWSVDGTSLVSGASVGFNPGPSWHAIGSGDFNADGKADILWQNASGQAAVWLMDGSNILSGANVGFNPGAAWHVIEAGDFDGDGKADILWQNNNGQAAVWLMDGTTVKSGANAGPNPGADWHVIGTGDFDGDGKADILWQNKSGQAAVWLMDGTTVKAAANVGFNPGADWNVQGAGDFNGDGKADILWQNANGQAAIWEMNGLTVLGGSNVGFNPGPAWQVHGTGDFNGDGKADIAWQNTDGTAAVWLMDGYNVVSGANVGFDPGAAWHVVPQHHDALV